MTHANPPDARFAVAAALATATVVVFLSACGAPEVDIPDPPNMNPLVNAYENPDGTLDGDNQTSVSQLLAEQLGLYEDTGGFLGDLVGGFGQLGGGLTYDDNGDGYTTVESPVSVGGTTFEGNGVVRINRICQGWSGGEFGPDPKDGRAELTSIFSDGGFDPVIWGRLLECQELIGDPELTGATELLADGRLNIHTGSLLTDLSSVSGAPNVIFALVGDLEIDGALDFAELDFRTLEGGFELRIPVADGNIIFVQSSDFTGFRTSEGFWQCDDESNMCTFEDTGEQLPFF